MRARKVYPIIRNLDYLQDNEEISAAIYEVVSQLIGYEDPSNPAETPGNVSEDAQCQSQTVESSEEKKEDKSEIESHLDEID